MSNPDRLIAYLRAYAAKDLSAIREMFAENIRLRDWKISVSGLAAALDETAKNFASAGSMEIEALRLYPAGDTVAAELRIVIDGTVELRVVDVVSFDASGRITAIRAYLGRPDE